MKPQDELPAEVRSGAEAAARSHWLHGLARLGLAARGAIYVLVGLLAVQVASGHRQREADQNGALLTVARQPFGKVLLWVLAIGFAGYAFWRFTEVLLGETGGDRGSKGRAKSLVRALIYASLCFTTVSLITGRGNAQGGSARQSVTLTARAMQHGWSRALVGVAGAVLIGVGGMLVVEGVRRKFEKYLRLQEMSPRTRLVVERLGMFGTAARGLVFGTAGFFLISAAVTFNPHKARGLDGALSSLARSAGGPWLLGVVALGLVSFGVYGLAEARYRRVGQGGSQPGG